MYLITQQQPPGTPKEEIRKYHLIVKSQPQQSEVGNGQAEVTSTGRPLMQHSLATSTHTFEKEVQMYSQVCISGHTL